MRDTQSIDAELLDIFLSEAEEVLAGVRADLHGLQAAADMGTGGLAAGPDLDLLTQLRRAFHTLKGSGRMVGLTRYGEAAWAIEQVFPILPIHRLNERPAIRASLCDLTCDSDGRIDHYVDRGGLEPTLPLHALKDGEDYLLAFFMVGAYQEILGGMHNLFGDTNAVNVILDGKGGWYLEGAEQGDRTDELRICSRWRWTPRSNPMIKRSDLRRAQTTRWWIRESRPNVLGCCLRWLGRTI